MPVKFQRPKIDDKIDLKDYHKLLTTVEALANMKVVGGKFMLTDGGASLDVSTRPASVLRHAQLTAALAVAGAGAPEANATTATFKFFIYNSTGGPTLPVDIVLGDEEPTLVNRSQDLSGVSGDYIIVSKVYYKNGFEWVIVAKDC